MVLNMEAAARPLHGRPLTCLESYLSDGYQSVLKEREKARIGIGQQRAMEI